jgi:hypothetical protein
MLLHKAATNCFKAPRKCCVARSRFRESVIACPYPAFTTRGCRSKTLLWPVLPSHGPILSQGPTPSVCCCPTVPWSHGYHGSRWWRGRVSAGEWWAMVSAPLSSSQCLVGSSGNRNWPSLACEVLCLELDVQPLSICTRIRGRKHVSGTFARRSSTMRSAVAYSLHCAFCGLSICLCLACPSHAGITAHSIAFPSCHMPSSAL